LQRGADVNKQLQLAGGATALALVCATGRVNAARALIAGGASVALSNRMDMDPLIRATLRDHSELVALLLENGADANKQYRGGYTALTISCELGFFSVAEALINGGASTNFPNREGARPLDYAARGPGPATGGEWSVT
jgi:ankyrin repeat protein